MRPWPVLTVLPIWTREDRVKEHVLHLLRESGEDVCRTAIRLLDSPKQRRFRFPSDEHLASRRLSDRLSRVLVAYQCFRGPRAA